MNAPQWWYVVSGLFFGLGIVFYVVLVALLVVMIQMLRKLNTQVQALMKKIDGITTRVDTLVVEVREVTHKVGVQATGAATSINSLTKGIAEKAEIASVVFLILGALRGFLAGSRKAKNSG